MGLTIVKFSSFVFFYPSTPYYSIYLGVQGYPQRMRLQRRLSVSLHSLFPATVNLFGSMSNQQISNYISIFHSIFHYSFSRSKYLHLLLTPVKRDCKGKMKLFTWYTWQRYCTFICGSSGDVIRTIQTICNNIINYIY